MPAKAATWSGQPMATLDRPSRAKVLAHSLDAASQSGYCTTTRMTHGSTSSQVSREASLTTAGLLRQEVKSSLLPMNGPIIRPIAGQRTSTEILSTTA